MSGGDRTGPFGMGPRSGRADGHCGGIGIRGHPNLGRRSGFGLSRGSGRGGRGWRNWFYATGLPGWMRFGGYAMPDLPKDTEMEKRALKNQAEALQAELDLIKKRLGELEADVKVQ